MIAPFPLAFGSARVRALKSSLLGPDAGAALRAARSLANVSVQAGIPAIDPRELSRGLVARLVVDYEKVIGAFPGRRSLLLALFRLREVENLKLGWRAKTHGLPPESWTPLWVPLGRRAALPRELFEGPESPRQLLPSLSRTPYGEICLTVFRSLEGAAAERAFERWAEVELLTEARRLPLHERAARDLVEALLRERDVDAVRRLRAAFGFSPEAALQSLVLLPSEEPMEQLARFASWKPGDGPLRSYLPRGLGRLAADPEDWEALQRALRRHRHLLCRRAFLGPPFRIAPALAYLLWREEEVRALGAFAQSVATGDGGAPLEDALAASPLGD